MNETQRKLAAYQSATGKSAKPKGPPRVSVELGGSLGAKGQKKDAAPSGRTRRPAPKSSEPATTPKTEGLLKAAADHHGYRKVARFLMLLGQEEAAKILRHFSPTEIEAISAEVARVRSVDADEARQLLKEFGAARTRTPHPSQAGPDAARAILTAAFGEERAKALMRKTVGKGSDAPFNFLADLDYEQVLLLMKDESARAVSIIVPHLEPKKAARIVERLPEDIRHEVILRIARMEKVDQDVINRIEAVLKERLRTQGTVIAREIDGRAALAEILKHMDLSSEESIIGELAELDPELSKDVQDRVFTFDIILKIDDQDLQVVLREFDDTELATVLKGKSEAVTEKVLSNVSVRRKATIADEIDHLGSMRKRDVDRPTKEMLDYLIELDSQGKITIHWDDRLVP